MPEKKQFRYLDWHIEPGAPGSVEEDGMISNPGYHIKGGQPDCWMFFFLTDGDGKTVQHTMMTREHAFKLGTMLQEYAMQGMDNVYPIRPKGDTDA